ncbi:ABC transporter substrate-binding protein [Bradyrhizobium sp. McL0616]|uniref:ABC transporter substrate-binding protein n=1 Tax=Bradyrhizobium sp. McL0616 TaxID=3415674 RepID=UPI003CF5CE21
MRHIGVLVPLSEGDHRGLAGIAGLRDGLRQLGWIDGRNLSIDIHWSNGGSAEVQRAATDLVALRPDVLVAVSATATGPMLQATHTLPIVFVNVADPVGAGFVERLARPGGNATGFTSFDYGVVGKWLDLLKQTVPALRRVVVVRDSTIATGIGQLGAIQSIATSLGIGLTPVGVEDASEIEGVISSLARNEDAGLIVTGSASALARRKLFVELAGKYKLPAIYFERAFAAEGGLMSYGSEFGDNYRRAAAYVDRILKGEKPADLPVQTPTKYHFVLNLKTAKQLELTVPASVLAIADEVIE